MISRDYETIMKAEICSPPYVSPEVKRRALKELEEGIADIANADLQRRRETAARLGRLY